MVPPTTGEKGSGAAGNEEKNKANETQPAAEEKEVPEKKPSGTAASESGSSAVDTPQSKEQSAASEKNADSSKETVQTNAASAPAAAAASTAASPAAASSTAASSAGAPASSSAAPGVQTAEATKGGKGPELLANGLPKIVYDLPSASSSSSGGARPNVYLDAADSHLDLQIDKENPLRATCMHTGGFQYMWKGVRASCGVKGRGKFFFEVKVEQKSAPVVMPDTPINTQHVCRVGVSQPLTSLHLGDSAESWGFGGTGKKSTNRKYSDYGASFGEGDVIGVCIDFENLVLSFTKNGQYLGTAFELPAAVRETGLFPHIYVKNYNFSVNFSEKNQSFKPPGPQFKFIGDLPHNELLPNPVEHPQSVSECEFIMMCGLPACGKTYWLEKHVDRHPKKAYVLLGTNAVIDQMKVMGLKRQANYANRWEELMSTATEVFNSLVAYAGSGVVPRNIIIDQTNVFKRARARKVQPFLSWGVRRCVVMVTDERTLQERTQKREREEGKMVPVSAVMDMKAAFALPSFDDGFTVIDYVEMPESESRREIRRINEEGRAYKANNPGVNNRQPKPHIEARGGYGDADASAAKRHKGDHWQANPSGGPHSSWGGPHGGPPHQSWSGGGGPQGGPPGGRGPQGYGGPQGGRGPWGGQGQQQQWGGGGPQGGWQEQHRSSSNGGPRYNSGGNGGYGGGYEYDSHYQQQHQQGYDSNYYSQQRQQQHGVYDSRGGQQHYQQQQHHQQQQWHDAYSNNRGWQGPPNYGGGSRGGYYQQQGRY